MILKDFINQFVAPNSLICLWEKYNNPDEPSINAKTVITEGNGLCMEWEITSKNEDRAIYRELGDWEVLYISDIAGVKQDPINITIQSNGKPFNVKKSNIKDEPSYYSSCDCQEI
jgi:hypothetical protein